MLFKLLSAKEAGNLINTAQRAGSLGINSLVGSSEVSTSSGSKSVSRLLPIDCTWFLPNSGRNGRAEFFEERIPGAIYLDLDEVCDKTSPFPHMLPNHKTFEKSMNVMGVCPDDTLLVYDRGGNFSGPRGAWMMAIMGHQGPVYLLNNFITYRSLGLPLETDDPKNIAGSTNYTVQNDFVAEEVLSFEQIRELVLSRDIRNYNAYDARANDRYRGLAPEPRPEMSPGHVPGFESLPFPEVLDPDTKLFNENPEELREQIMKAIAKYGGSYDPRKPTIVMCGSGVSALVIKTALEYSGVEKVKVYDGSWTEWATRAESDLIITEKRA